MASTITDSLEKNSGTLILGASGRLGRMMQAFWPDQAALTLHSRQAIPNFIQFDLILEPDQAAAAMVGKSSVICLSGVTNACAEATGEVYSRNTDLALAAVNAAAKAGVDRVFLASSAAVYGAAPGLQSETETPQPIAPYGKAKLAMEKAALARAAELGQAVTCLRIGNVAGADAILGGWHPDMHIDLLENGTTPARSYIGPQTLAHVLAQLCVSPKLPDTLNIASPGVIRMGDLLDAAALPWSSRPAPSTVIAQVALCTNRLESHISFAPEASTAAGMVAEWHRFKSWEKEGQP